MKHDLPRVRRIDGYLADQEMRAVESALRSAETLFKQSAALLEQYRGLRLYLDQRA